MRRMVSLVAIGMLAAMASAFEGTAWAADAPQLTSVTRATVAQSSTHVFVANGSGFQDGATFALENGSNAATASTVTVNSSNGIQATVFVSVPRGTYDAVVTNPDGQKAVLADAVTVGDFPPVVPLIDCIERDPETGAATARFGYVNSSGNNRTMQYGSDNFFLPIPNFRGQPSFFSPGLHRGAFEYPFGASESSMTWSLFFVRATANPEEGPYCDAPTPGADLRVSQSAPEPAVAGGNLTYTLTAANDGPSDAPDVVLTDALPGDVEFVSAEASKGACAEGEIAVCRIGNLAKDESATARITVKPERRGTLVNTTTVFSTETRDPETMNNSSTERTPVVSRPSAMTGAASDVTRNGATIKAFVDTGEADTTFRFEYGEGASFGNTTPEQNAAPNPGPSSVEAAIEGLKPGTKYHYRIVAENAHGTSTGETETFTTSALATTRLTLGAKPGAIKSGRKINRAGRLFAPGGSVANRRVVLYQRAAGTRQFMPIRATNTNVNGAFVFRGLKPRATTFYQIRFAGNKDDGLKASNSPVRRVVVRR
ncbi:MAG: DUF11 domain-containing protein [Rubrobacter sp.]|nr:DUF11 domain-containing protein [Rubrobacter sp.]